VIKDEILNQQLLRESRRNRISSARADYVIINTSRDILSTRKRIQKKSQCFGMVQQTIFSSLRKQCPRQL
jgi:hypothetical protein